MTRFRSALIGGLFVIGATGGYVGIVAPHASAAGTTIAVTTTDDELNADGFCSLREAVEAANTDAAVDACPAGNGADVIAIPWGTFVLGTQLDLTDPAGVIIKGRGANDTKIDGGGATRLFSVHRGPFAIGTVFLSNGDAGTADGGAILSDDDDVTLFSVLVIGSRGGNGGAIKSTSGDVTITGSSFSANRAEFGPLSENGGAINVGQGTVTIRASSFTGNSAVNAGGALLAAEGAIDVADSTFSDNTALAGGAMFDVFGTTLLVNTTLDGNTATRINGGRDGTVQSGGSDADITMRNVTLTGTITGFGASPAAELILSNTVIADKEAGDCTSFRAITSHGGNLNSDGTCDLSDDTDLVADPQLGPLSNRGGGTLTRLPLTGSPLIDGGVNGGCEPTDQRGEARPLDGDGDGLAVCDRGAVESDAVDAPPTTTEPPPPTTTTTTDPGSTTITTVDPGATTTTIHQSPTATTDPGSSPTTAIEADPAVAVPSATDPRFTG